MTQAPATRSGARNRTPVGSVAAVLAVTFGCALLIKAFVLDAYRIPSSSMEQTLLPGDMILVNKLAYGLRMPSSLPLLPISLEPSYVLPLGNIRRGDIVVFENYRHRGMPGGAERFTLVKRVVGRPGDSVALRHGRVLVNGREMIAPATVHFPRYDRVSGDVDLYPPGRGYSELEYGPVRVPARGDVVTLTAANIGDWRHLLLREGWTVDTTGGGAVLLDGVATETYRLAHDYYFVLGDSRDNSTDSRMFGFVSEADIIGEGMMIYWSSRREGVSHPFAGVRWQRVGSIIR